ncbi:hypothetical protein [Streptomyces sp. NBC_00572]|uniref:hypothetical protein n=1 Tax=Streptomyces sp. NBC_00572 TaxID=2903664 RepID=UPI002251CA39|nr:hypothetical protein [Streptomyces sp. NBC_00572]MCX4985115.1 hypothetical protein [Streptomyces sp. NBC_00572]
MHDPKLTHQERMILEGIEEGLRGDESLNRRLRTLGLAHARRHEGAGGAWGAVLRNRLGWCTIVLGIACVALFGLAAASSSPAPIWCFAAVWVVTAVCLIRLLQRAVERRRNVSARRGTD